MRIDPVLVGDRIVEVAVLLPRAGNIAEIAVPRRRLAEARTSHQGLEGDGVEGLPLCLRTPAQLRVQPVRDVPQRVLHSESVGDAGIQPKRTPRRLDLTTEIESSHAPVCPGSRDPGSRRPRDRGLEPPGFREPGVHLPSRHGLAVAPRRGGARSAALGLAARPLQPRAWKAGWDQLFRDYELVHNRRTTLRIVLSEEGDGAFAVVDVDTLWRH